MRKINLLLLALLFTASAYGQKASLSVTFSLTFDLSVASPDSIKVTNLSSGGDTTLYGSDTILVLDYPTGLEDVIPTGNALSLSQNYPNPFREKTNFNVFINTDGQIEISVFEVAGRELASFSDYYTAGTHNFSFFSGGGLFILKARYNDVTRSVKMYSTMAAGSKDCSVVYNGKDNSAIVVKSVKSTNNLWYSYGDQLKSVVYYQLNYKTTHFIPTQDTVINVNFHSPSPCPVVFTDPRDNHVYSTVQIGSQCWMAENLAYLPQVSPSGTGSETTPYYYVYGYDGSDVSAAMATNNYQTYGVLYNWPAAMAGHLSSNDVPSDVQGICPVGWHLPSDEEWKILEGEVDSQYGYPNTVWNVSGMRGTDAGGNLKETGTTHWGTNTGATNSSGFTALPGGSRDGTGVFGNIGSAAYFLPSTDHFSGNAWLRYLFGSSASIGRGYYSKANGDSVRCLLD